MSDFIDQFFGDAKQLKLTDKEHAQVFTALKAHTKVQALTSLSADEKEEVLGNLMLHMRNNPIQQKRSVFDALAHYFSFHRLTAGVLTVALLCSVSGGVTYAAESAMPDDILYPVKLHVNEPIITALQRTPENKIAWEERRLQRRLTEAEHIAKREELVANHEEQIRARIEQRMEHLSSFLENVPEEEKEQIAERIDAKLAKHQEFLDALDSGELPPPPEHVRKLRSGVQDARQRFRERHGRPPRPLQPETEFRLPRPEQREERQQLRLPTKPNRIRRENDVTKPQKEDAGKDIRENPPRNIRIPEPKFLPGTTKRDQRLPRVLGR